MATTRTKRLVLLELFIFFTLAGTTAVLFQPLMEVVNKNINALRDSLIRTGEEALDRPIRYRSMSPSLIGKVELYSVSLGERADPLLKVDRLYLEYSPWDLIRGRGIKALRKLVLEGPEIIYDPRRDGNLKTLFQSEKKEPLPALPRNGILQISQGSLRIKTGTPADTFLYLGGISLFGEAREGWIDLEGRWEKPPDAGLPGEAGSFLSARGTVRGSFSGAWTDGTLSVEAQSVEGRGFTLENLALQGFLSEDKIVFSRARDGLPLEISASYVPSQNQWSLVFSADRFSPRSMASLRGPLEKFSPLLDLRFSGDAVFVLNGNPLYRFNLSAENETNNPGPIRSFAVEGEGNARRIAFSRCRLEARRGSVQYTGDMLLRPLKPQGTVNFVNFTLTGEKAINGALNFERRNQAVLVNSLYLSLGNDFLSGLSGRMLWNEESYSLRFNGFGGGSFSCGGSFSQKAGWMNGTLTLDRVYVSGLMNLARPFVGLGQTGAWTDKTALSTELSFFTDFRSLSYRTGDFLAAYGSRESFSASLSGTEKYLDLSRGTLRWSGGSAQLDFHARFENPGDMSFGCNFSYQDFSYALEGTLANRRSIRVRGSNDFLAEFRYRQGQGWTGSASVYGAPVPYLGRRAYLYVDAELEYHNPSLWNAALRRFEIREFQGPGLLATDIFVRGQANQNGLNLDRIDYEDRYGKLAGSAAAIWGRGLDGIDGSVVLTTEAETERVSADFFFHEGILEYHAALQGFKVDRFAQSGKNLSVSGELYGVRNNDGYYSLSLSLESLTGRSGTTLFSASGLVLLDPEQMIASRIYISTGALEDKVEMEIPYLSVDRDAGRLDTEGRVDGRINKHDLGLVMSLGMNFQPLEGWLDLRRIGETFSGALSVQHAFINNREIQEPFSFIFSRIEEGDNPGVIRLAGGPEDMLRLELREQDSRSSIFTAALSAPSPVQGTFTGILEGTQIDGMATDVFVDLAGLWDITPIDKTVNFTGGFITGETRISGSIFDPEFDGAAWGAGVRLSVPEYIPAEIGPGTGDILLQGSAMSFGPIAAACGDGRGEVTGWIEFNRWIPSVWLDIGVDTPVPFDFDISGIKARGNALGTLNLFLDNKETFTITGDVEASDTEITVNAAEIEQAGESLYTPEDVEVIADVYIQVGRRVEFLWPSSETPLLRTYGDTGSGVRILGDTRIPQLSLAGDLTLRGGELYYLQRTFFIREGQINFNANDPRIDPRISARAEIKDQNDEGPVTITMVIENTPLSVLFSSTPRFESSPSLSQVEIFSLLGQAPPTGTASAEAQELNPIINTSIEMVLQSVVFRRFERLVRNVLGLDMFSFRTQIVQNAIFEAFRNREPDGPPSTVGSYLDKTAVFMGKYLGPDLFLQGILNFSYDQYQVKYGGMKLEPEIGLEMKTPLFNVRWNVSLQHPKDLYVSDQSISLLWHWSL